MNNEAISQEIMNEIREERLKQLKWLENKRMGYTKVNSLAKDIHFNVVKSSHKIGKSVNITFRNLCCEKITSTGRLIVAPIKNRIYIKEADERGYKLTVNRRTQTSRFISMPLFDKCTAFIGDYDLQYDEFLGLHYIEKEDK